MAVVNYLIINWNNGSDTSCHSSPNAMNTAAVCHTGDVIFMMSCFIKGDMSCPNCSFLHSSMKEIPQFKSIIIEFPSNTHTALANAIMYSVINDCTNWGMFEQPDKSVTALHTCRCRIAGSFRGRKPSRFCSYF